MGTAIVASELAGTVIETNPTGSVSTAWEAVREKARAAMEQRIFGAFMDLKIES